MSVSERFNPPDDAELATAIAGLSREFALICEPDGRILWADDRAVQMNGIKPGGRVIDLMTSHSRSKSREFLAQAALNAVEQWELAIRAVPDPIVIDCSGAPWNGKILIVASRLPADHESAIVELSRLVSDLSNLQRESIRQKSELQRLFLALETANEQIEREHEILETIVGKLPSGVFVASRSASRPYVANAALEEILGTPPAGAAGLPPDLLVEDSSGQRVEVEEWPVHRSVTHGERIEDEAFEITRPDGLKRIVEISSIPIRDSNGNILYAVAVFHDITHLKLLQRQLKYDSQHDALTGLPNRSLLALRVSEALVQADTKETRIAVLFVDLDGFKQINDTLGHRIGDLVLVEVARRLCTTVRDGDMVARLAGDEFVVLLDNVRNDAVPLAVAGRIIAEFEEPIEIEGNEIVLSSSVGVALSGEDLNAPNDLIDSADSAMYVAKERGKGQFWLAGSESPATGGG
ncbi:hypothetical protein BH23CHL2_BH23CHL2_12240 [soil metagenome]